MLSNVKHTLHSMDLRNEFQDHIRQIGLVPTKAENIKQKSQGTRLFIALIIY